ncbi:Protein shisa-6-like protein Precursor [Larimichthys crocea]|uniref:Protein shisa-6-like protein n=1 Tax=Larimichthys crocea TaxID=215358 RepID=A0A6G0HUW7_LARCR|nr:Protein shisa-6-like protein Precursor [Larimichthys crocea]
MSQDHVLSPPRTPRRETTAYLHTASWQPPRTAAAATSRGAAAVGRPPPLPGSIAAVSGDEADKFREKAMARAMSHADMLLPITPVMDRHKMTKMHSQPSASNDSYNTLTVNHQVTTSKRQAFASRRTHSGPPTVHSRPPPHIPHCHIERSSTKQLSNWQRQSADPQVKMEPDGCLN